VQVIHNQILLLTRAVTREKTRGQKHPAGKQIDNLIQ
jgi:hypothetical protein